MSTKRSNATVNSPPTPADASASPGNDLPPLPNDLSVCHALIRELIAALHQTQRHAEGIQ